MKRHAPHPGALHFSAPRYERPCCAPEPLPALEPPHRSASAHGGLLRAAAWRPSSPLPILRSNHLATLVRPRRSAPHRPKYMTSSFRRCGSHCTREAMLGIAPTPRPLKRWHGGHSWHQMRRAGQGARRSERLFGHQQLAAVHTLSVAVQRYSLAADVAAGIPPKGLRRRGAVSRTGAPGNRKEDRPCA